MKHAQGDGGMQTCTCACAHSAFHMKHAQGDGGMQSTPMDSRACPADPHGRFHALGRAHAYVHAPSPVPR